MEKRFFLAIFLSFIILYGWSAIFKTTPSLDSQKQAKVNEYEENKTVSTILDSKATLDDSPINIIDSKENIYTLQSAKLSVDFSDKGGLIQKVTINEYNYSLPIKNYLNIDETSDFIFNVSQQSSYEIEFQYEYKDYLIKRRYKLSDNDYLIDVDIIFVNKTDSILSKNIQLNGFLIDSSSLDISSKNAAAARDKGLLEYVLNVQKEIIRKNKAYQFSEKDSKLGQVPVNWFAFRDRYFCTIIKPLFKTTGYATKIVDKDKLNIEFSENSILMPSQGQISFSATIFTGPEKIKLLKTYESGFEDIQMFYRFPLFDAIAKVMYGLLHMVHKVIPIWGVCIMLIGTIVYFSMYPLTIRSMLSMKRMQALQPKMAALKEKYKSDPQKMNQAVMALYKENKVNPLGGCLPMLLQMPVFIGLYQVLWRSVSFKGEKFLWMKDLSEPDRLFILPTTLPLIGNEINILPILMMVIMFFQQKLSAKNMVASNPDQIAQQKMMGRIFPLFLGFIFYKFASGLTLYFTMFYIFSTFTQWKMSKVEV